MLRRINERTWKQLSELNKDEVRLILPISSLEQHGTHMPVGTDDFISSIGIDTIVENPKLKSDYWLLPAIHYGCSFEHMKFPGTFSISPATLSAMVEDILASMVAHGWKTLVLVNSHGGNQGVLFGSAQTWRYRYGVKIYYVNLLHSAETLLDNVLELPENRDGHAGESETSVLLAGKPEVVNTEALKTQADMTEPIPELLASWLTHELSPTGVLGGATLATAEKGAKLIDAVERKMIEILDGIANE